MSLCLSPLILQTPFTETGTAGRYGNDMVWTADIFPGGGTTRSSPAPHLTIALDSLHSLFIDHNGGGTAAGGTVGFKNGNGFEKVFTVATLVNKSLCVLPLCLKVIRRTDLFTPAKLPFGLLGDMTPGLLASRCARCLAGI